MLQSLHRILLALTMAVALPALAQGDPPARVGRLAYFENQVDFRVDRSEQGGPATLNWPISSGAVLETGARGRAEVWIGSTAYRLADDSQVEFPVVDDKRVEVRVAGGSLAVSILDRDQVDDVVIATPDGDVRFLTPGRYRIDVFADRSELSVQAGRAVFDDGQRATPVAAGQKVSHWSDGNEQFDADRGNDAFDRWVASRENVTLASQARRHVSPHMTGYQDLDAYGDWQSAPGYGSVWYPRAVADDWAPYRYGRWAWIAPWGWTWIDQAPWGFAPFHYGRWAIIHGRWGWIPGRLVARPVYAPALVAWIGNPGWSISFSFGAAPAVGWFPLAPREVYVPGHRHSANYVRQINVAYVRDVKVIDRVARDGRQAPFANRAVPRAVTVVPAKLLREGHAITGREIQRQERPALGRAPLARQAPNADWLAPEQGARRPRNDEKREPINRPRRDFDAPRLNAPERGTPRSEPMPRQPGRPAFRQPSAEPENRRDEHRGSPDLRRQIEQPGSRPGLQPAPVPARREAASQPVRREIAPPADVLPPKVRDMSPPERRTEEAQPRPRMQQQEGERRREMRALERAERVERPAPPPRERPFTPRPAPEVRMPASPAQREMPPPRVNPARQAPEFHAPAPRPERQAEPPHQPAPQGSQPEQRRRRGDDDDRRGR
ncbi:MAG: hypothetical protein CVU31_13175 [Betaproteobacteria bacterium HGW-Betaproteobacteria-4]|nr:MAG: hypothetical protein CVU31_13175 [Betaproteobacteria bacterium HGW-Betaproteobacteria-4]